MPGCDTKGRVFVGQRHDGFVVNLGHIFDLINLNPLGARHSSSNTIADKNVTSLALDVPAPCLTKGSDPVIGARPTASLPQSRVLTPQPQGPDPTRRAHGPATAGRHVPRVPPP